MLQINYQRVQRLVTLVKPDFSQFHTKTMDQPLLEASSSPRQAAVIIRIATVASDICVRILIGIMHRQVDAPYVLRFLPYQSWSLRIHACVFGTRARPIHELTHAAWRTTTHRRVHIRRVRVGARKSLSVLGVISHARD